MSLKARGKKRAIELEEANPASGQELPQKANVEGTLKRSKQKKAITRPCPVCSEDIPLRLLGAHLELERTRVEELVESIGKEDVYVEEWIDKDAGGKDEIDQPHARRAALKARRSINQPSTSSSSRTLPAQLLSTAATQEAEHTIRGVVRNRKARFAKLRDLGRDLEPAATASAENVCPVCMQFVTIGEEGMEEHIDACIWEAANQPRLNGINVIDVVQEYEIDGQARIRVTDLAGFRGTGFDVRDRSQVDLEGDVDVDGGDEVQFGDSQFTERDIIASTATEGDFVDVENRDLRDLVSTPIRRPPPRPSLNGDSDSGLQAAYDSGDTSRIIDALKARISRLENDSISKQDESTPSPSTHQPQTCRICLDVYTDPTVSTGCWHTCCSACWLRCLGATKLCPICKRITGVAELRRIYL